MIRQTTWSRLSTAEQRALLRRPATATADAQTCQRIIDQVRSGGDQALRELTQQFDHVSLEALQVPVSEIEGALASLSANTRNALEAAHANISGFHQQQLRAASGYSPVAGVDLEIQYRPIDAVGLYVPGGTAPLPSTVLMLGVPSALAACPARVMCTPPQANGRVNPLVLAAAALCGIEHVYSIGGAQAIAAMAFGTETIPKVNKIFGPGNPWVTRAKQLVAQNADGAGLDMPAGPSEVLVIADEFANAEFIAADLLSQAEHGVDSQVILLTTSVTLADQVRDAVERQTSARNRAHIIKESLAHSQIVITESLGQAIAISNEYAPEHLILNTRSARTDLASVTSAGSVFLGAWTPESVGDYASGTNHVLPTYGYAKFVSGIGVADFQKRITVQELSIEGLQNIGWVAATLATEEGLDAHAYAVQVRLDSRESGQLSGQVTGP